MRVTIPGCLYRAYGDCFETNATNLIMHVNQVWFSNRRAKWRRHQRMNLLKRSSPGPGPGNHHHQQQQQIYSSRLTPSPHYGAASTPGSPLTTPHRSALVGPQQQATSLLLQMGGENSAFKALVPTTGSLFSATGRLGGYLTDSDEEINVNDESDVEEPARSKSSSPVEVVDPPPLPPVSKDDPPASCQPLQLTMHDRD